MGESKTTSLSDEINLMERCDSFNETDTEVPFKLLFFKPPEMNKAFNYFCGRRESVGVNLVLAVIASVSFFLIIMRDELFGFIFYIRLLRVSCVGAVGYHVIRTISKTNAGLVLDSDTTVWLSAYVAIVWQVAGGIILLHESMLPRCANGVTDITLCNPWADFHRLPAESIYTNIIMVFAVPVLFKAHSAIAVGISFLCFASSIFAALIVSSATSDATVFFACIIFMAVILYENEMSRLYVFLSSQQAHRYYKEVIVAERLKQASDHEKDFVCSVLGNVAHDLKTPLQSFMSEVGMLESALEDVFSHSATVDMSECRCEIDGIISSLKECHSFMMLAINRGIDFRKIHTGRALQINNESFLVSSALDWAVSRFKGSDVQIHISRSASSALCPFIVSDQHFFRENLMSLLANALKFTAWGSIDVTCELCELVQKGSVLIAQQQAEHIARQLIQSPTSHEQQKQNAPLAVLNIDRMSDVFSVVVDDDTCGATDVPVSYERLSKLFVIVCVEDSGVGLPPSILTDLFKPFVQGQRNTGGTGLGLFSISKRMEAIGGYCGAKLRDDGKDGSCFWLAYPYVPDWHAAKSITPSSVLVPAPRRIPNNPSIYSVDIRLWEMVEALPTEHAAALPYAVKDPVWRNVLLVEDSPIVTKAIIRLLQREGFKVELAKNGSEGLKKLKKNRYAIVLSDIQMPIMDGLEMVQRFREHEQESGAMHESMSRQMIIGMSANSDYKTEQEALSVGMNYFIPKPLAKSSLRSCLLAEYLTVSEKNKWE